jgi:hypothetical protein
MSNIYVQVLVEVRWVPDAHVQLRRTAYFLCRIYSRILSQELFYSTEQGLLCIIGYAIWIEPIKYLGIDSRLAFS